MKERAASKKIAIFSLWILLLLPFIVLAQDEPLNCCKLSETVTIGGIPFMMVIPLVALEKLAL